MVTPLARPSICGRHSALARGPRYHPNTKAPDNGGVVGRLNVGEHSVRCEGGGCKARSTRHPQGTGICVRRDGRSVKKTSAHAASGEACAGLSLRPVRLRSGQAARGLHRTRPASRGRRARNESVSPEARRRPWSRGGGCGRGRVQPVLLRARRPWLRRAAGGHALQPLARAACRSRTWARPSRRA